MESHVRLLISNTMVAHHQFEDWWRAVLTQFQLSPQPDQEPSPVGKAQYLMSNMGITIAQAIESSTHTTCSIRTPGIPVKNLCIRSAALIISELGSALQLPTYESREANGVLSCAPRGHECIDRRARSFCYPQAGGFDHWIPGSDTTIELVAGHGHI